MPINRLKSTPAFHADAPPQIRHAITLFAFMWFIYAFGWVMLSIAVLPSIVTQPKHLALLSGSIGFLACWLAMNACLIVGLCQRQKLARTLQLVLTVGMAFALLAAIAQFGLNFFAASFLANAVATGLLFLPVCSNWFDARATSPE
ncbi:hypothetical protein [Paraburkholderia acidisoli]|uniref:Uncharacterized protein n=1 Tax=Paraburkholderia acidisoli TaxID=2571748 RepID=A0A7Z2JJB1_9BURK|nr:hypothetical protein [Paraburkholderia acidisoli]QGZ66038.1 hypothetical protein FAZ98_29930 [Paraburkholderia acidisoli]